MLLLLVILFSITNLYKQVYYALPNNDTIPLNLKSNDNKVRISEVDHSGHTGGDLAHWEQPTRKWNRGF